MPSKNWETSAFYNDPPLDWQLKTDAFSPEDDFSRDLVYSGDPSSWVLSTHVEGILYGFDTDTEITNSNRPGERSSEMFSFSAPGNLYFVDEYPLNSINVLEQYGVTKPESPDNLDWFFKISEAKVSHVLLPMLVGPGNYKFIYEENRFLNKYSALSSGITLKTQSELNPVPLPPSFIIFLFGSGFLGVFGFRKAVKRGQVVRRHQ